MKSVSFSLAIGTVAVFAVALIVASTISFSSAVPPSACDNRLDAKIISFRVITGKKSIDVTKQSRVIDADINKGYNVNIVLQTSPQARNSGQGPASVWVTNTAYGFSSGTCYDNVKPGGRVSINIGDIQMGQATEGLIQQVKWGSLPNQDQVQYQIAWH
ncbi:MAG TPA: hypothetical protein VH415_09745 [Nitrososphaeraceae archaeon]